jgi:CubicO group peptidase (beta-lactamase class C family)
MRHKIFFLTGLFQLYMHIVCSQEAVDKAVLDSLFFMAAKTHSEALIIYHDNKPVIEKYFGDGRPNNKVEAMSVTKGIVGLAIACLQSDGQLKSLDEPVYKYYPEWNQGRKKEITIRQLLNNTSGLQTVANASAEIYPSNDFIQLALAAELSDKPGTVFNYNNKAVNLLAGIIHKITGKRMDLYIGERLFKPLGVTDYSWAFDRSGNPHAMSGCRIRASDLAVIGLLVLNGGRYKEKALIEEKYVRELTVPSARYEGYGLLWWIDHESVVSVVDDKSLAELEKAELDKKFIEKVKQMKGVYSSDQESAERAKKIFGKNAADYLNSILGPKDLWIRRMEFKGAVSWRSEGYLGNYLIVIPEKKLVAVRMTSSQSHKGDKDNFPAFGKMVRRLVK